MFCSTVIEEKRIILKDDSYIAFAGRQIGDVDALQEKPCGIWFFKSRNDAQNRGFCRCRMRPAEPEIHPLPRKGDVLSNRCFAETLLMFCTLAAFSRLLGQWRVLVFSRPRSTLVQPFLLGSYLPFILFQENLAQRKRTLKIAKDSSANTIAIAFAASICPSLNFRKNIERSCFECDLRDSPNQNSRAELTQSAGKSNNAPVTIAPRSEGRGG